MQDDFAALFAYDRWANRKVLDACRKLTAEQYVAKPVPAGHPAPGAGLPALARPSSSSRPRPLWSARTRVSLCSGWHPGHAGTLPAELRHLRTGWSVRQKETED